MTLPAIFCPQCDVLILEADQCPACDWHRPKTTGEVGQPVWAVALEVKLPRNGVRPVVADSFVYLPTENGQIVALNTVTSKIEEIIKWRYQCDYHYQSYSLAVWQDYLLLGNEYVGGFPAPQGELIIISAKSGEEMWRLPVEGASLSVPTVQNNVAYFTVNTNWLYAVDLVARRELWRHKLPASWSWASAAPLLTPSKLLILPARSDQLIAFDGEKGEIVWTFSAGRWFPHTPIWVDGAVYTRCWDRHLYAIDEASGKEIWRYQAPRDFSSDAWVDEHYLYIGVKDYQTGEEHGSHAYALYALDRYNGQRIGRYEVGGHIEARPVATESAIFFATDDRNREIESQGTFYALSSQTQQLLWDPYVVEQRFQSDLLLVGDLVIAGTRQGAVYAMCWNATEINVATPQEYLEKGEWENAAITYALQGNFVQAAEIYAKRLAQPLRAGRLYLRAGESRRVIELLGQSPVESERAVAIEAAQSLPKARQRAKSLRSLGENLMAANAFIETEEWLEAGACFEAAQAWAEARAVYFRANAWEKWEELTRKLQLWDELAERLVQAGDYAQAAVVYLERGLFAKAADCYDRAGMLAEALAAYRQVSPEVLPVEAQQRLAELAENFGEIDTAIAAYIALRQPGKAALLAEMGNQYELALRLYQEFNQSSKVAELLEKLTRFAEAAAIFAQLNRLGRAAANWEQQVDQAIEQAGGVRHLRKNVQVEDWLNQAIVLFEEAANVAEEATRIDSLNESADRCRMKLKQIRGEPLLNWSIQSNDVLVVGEGNILHYVVENVGWGPAEDLTLSISGNFLYNIDPQRLGTLRRKQKRTGPITIVPKIPGEVTLQVELTGRSSSGGLSEFETQTITVIRHGQTSSRGVATIDIQRITNIDTGGELWAEGSDSSPGRNQTMAISSIQLKHQQQLESLQRQLTRHYANLNKLQEQAAIYGAGQAPLELQNRIEAEENIIAEKEKQLRKLQT